MEHNSVLSYALLVFTSFFTPQHTVKQAVNTTKSMFTIRIIGQSYIFFVFNLQISTKYSYLCTAILLRDVAQPG